MKIFTAIHSLLVVKRPCQATACLRTSSLISECLSANLFMELIRDSYEI